MQALLLGAVQRSATPQTHSAGCERPSMGGGMSFMDDNMPSMGGGMSFMSRGMPSMSRGTSSMGGGHGGRFTGEYMATRGAANSRPIFEGVRGGQYHITPSGNKSYLRK